jgi:hypothetical protein
MKSKFELWSNADFPDLKKAFGAKGLKDLIQKIKPGESIYEIANDEKKKLEKQYRGDFRAAIMSHGGAIAAGNKNSCADKKQLSEVATQQQRRNNENTRQIKLPSYGKRRVVAKRLPKRRGLSPAKDSQQRQPPHPSIQRVKLGNFNEQSSATYSVDTIAPRNLNAKSSFKNFARSQAGYKGKLIDRAVGFTHDGTPQYSDDALNQANQDNLSANLANTPPTLDIPIRVKSGNTIDANKLQRKQAGQIQDKGDSVGNILKLGVIAAGVTAILFMLRDIIGVASFVINVSTVTSTVTNIAQSFLTIFDSIGSLLGLNEGLSKPISDTFDGILNSIFGKEKVEYVKYNFARINAIFNAGANILSRVRGTSAALAEGIEENAQNTSKIGNALRRAGIVDEKLRAMDEQIAVNVDKSQLKILNEKLSKVSNVSSELAGITTELKSAQDELKQLDKDQAEKEKQAQEKKVKTDKTEEKETGNPVNIPTLSNRGV